jgi:hypothetical protein
VLAVVSSGLQTAELITGATIISPPSAPPLWARRAG